MAAATLAVEKASTEENGVFPFLDLPFLVRHEIYNLLIPEDKTWFIRPATFWPRGVSVKRKREHASPSTYTRFSRIFGVRDAMKHWETTMMLARQTPRHPRGPPDAISALKSTCRDVKADLDSFLFAKLHIWIELDDKAIRYFDLAARSSDQAPDEMDAGPVSERTRTKEAVREPPRKKPRISNAEKCRQRAVLSWLASFRQISFLVPDASVKSLPVLMPMLRAAVAHQGNIQRRCIVQFTICGCKELFYCFSSVSLYKNDPKNGYNDGKLPKSLLEHGRPGFFDNVEQQGDTDLWINKNRIHYLRDADLLFYRILWRANIEEVSLGVTGSFIAYTHPGTMKAMLGWEPSE